MSDDFDTSEDEYIPSSSSSLPMILAALGVGTVVGAIIGFMASPSVEDATTEDRKHGLLAIGHLGGAASGLVCKEAEIIRY